jgi:hypothetical protein
MEGRLIMPENKPSIKELTQMINGVMGDEVLTEQQLEQILQGAKRANDRGGMGAVLDYLMKVTQTDVNKKELREFADNVKSNPKMGMDILRGKKKVK